MEAGRETSLPTARMDVPSSSSSSSHFDDLVSAERESSSSGGEQRRPLESLCLALHSLMMDSGYLPEEEEGGASSRHGDGRSGVWRTQYSCSVCQGSKVTLVCAVMGPLLAIHASARLTSEGREAPVIISCSSQLKIGRYSRPLASNEGGRGQGGRGLVNTQQLCRVFQDSVAHKLLTDIRKALGLAEVGTFNSLFPEIKLRVMRLLDVSSLLCLAASSRELSRLSSDALLWRDLLARDFGKGALPKYDATVDFKKLYRERFALRRQSEAWRRGADADFLPPLLPHPFPAPPPSLHPHFPGVIGGEYDIFPPPLASPFHSSPWLRPHSVPPPRHHFPQLPGPVPDPRNPFQSLDYSSLATSSRRGHYHHSTNFGAMNF